MRWREFQREAGIESASKSHGRPSTMACPTRERPGGQGGAGRSFLAGHSACPFETAAVFMASSRAHFRALVATEPCGRCRCWWRRATWISWAATTPSTPTLACFELPICNRCFVPPLSQRILVCHSAAHVAGFCRSAAGRSPLRNNLMKKPGDQSPSRHA